MAAQFEVIEEIVNYSRYLAQQHTEIGGFITGETSELNASNHTYPLLWLKWPITVTPLTDVNQQETLRMKYTFGVFANSIDDGNGNEIIVNDSVLPLPANQINDTGIIPQDQLYQKVIRIITHLIARMKYDIEQGNINAKFESSSFSTVSRVTVDDVYGAQCSIEFTLSDPYSCDIANVFTDLINAQ